MRKKWLWLPFAAAVWMCLTAACGGQKSPASASSPAEEREERSGDELWKTEGKTKKRELFLLEGTELSFPVTELDSGRAGASVYVIAGIHGDETAGWMAAERLKEVFLSAGTLTIVSPANVYGAEEETRLTAGERDLNRNFPGDPEGCDAEQIAAAIWEDICSKQPDLVLDLHEAQPGTDSRDGLGNSIICESLDSIGDLVLELLTESESGAICSEPLTIYGSPPPGSINRTVTRVLKIPVITVETLREEELERRIQNHLGIVEFILAYYGMVGE